MCPPVANDSGHSTGAQPGAVSRISSSKPVKVGTCPLHNDVACHRIDVRIVLVNEHEKQGAADVAQGGFGDDDRNGNESAIVQHPIADIEFAVKGINERKLLLLLCVSGTEVK